MEVDASAPNGLSLSYLLQIGSCPSTYSAMRRSRSFRIPLHGARYRSISRMLVCPSKTDSTSMSMPPQRELCRKRVAQPMRMEALDGSLARD